MQAQDRQKRWSSRALALLSAGLVAAAGIGPSRALDTLPELGDHSATILSRIEEERLGREFMRDAQRQLKYIGDPELNHYLSSLGETLVKNSDRPEDNFTFYLIQDNRLNAFAVPGGHISVHTGLIMAAHHESELASVLAHEIAHITQHHLARMVAQSRGQTVPAMAAIIAAILLGGAAGQAALIGANAQLIENQLAYSRAYEREADSIGIRTLARAGFDPRAMVAFFERLQQWGRIHDSSIPEFLRTHPLTSDRIADSLARAEQYPTVRDPDQADFHHARARIRALYADEPAAAARAFAANLQEQRYEDQNAERYGYALALAANGQYQEARQQMAGLLHDRPSIQSYVLAGAQIEMAAGRFDAAVTAFAKAYQAHTEDPVAGLYYANALVKTERYDEARQVLKRALLHRPKEPTLHALLARAEGESGNQLAAHQALAEHYYLRGNRHEALRQLALAKQYIGDSFYARASVEARTKEIEQELTLAGEKLSPPKSNGQQRR